MSNRNSNSATDNTNRLPSFRQLGLPSATRHSAYATATTPTTRAPSTGGASSVVQRMINQGPFVPTLLPTGITYNSDGTPPAEGSQRIFLGITESVTGGTPSTRRRTVCLVPIQQTGQRRRFWSKRRLHGKRRTLLPGSDQHLTSFWPSRDRPRRSKVGGLHSRLSSNAPVAGAAGTGMGAARLRR